MTDKVVITVSGSPGCGKTKVFTELCSFLDRAQIDHEKETAEGYLPTYNTGTATSATVPVKICTKQES